MTSHNNNTSISLFFRFFFRFLVESCSTRARVKLVSGFSSAFFISFFKSFYYHFFRFRFITQMFLRQSNWVSYSNSCALITTTKTTTTTLDVAKKRFRSVSACSQFQEFDRLISHSLQRSFSSSANIDNKNDFL